MTQELFTFIVIIVLFSIGTGLNLHAEKTQKEFLLAGSGVVLVFTTGAFLIWFLHVIFSIISSLPSAFSN